MMDEYFSLRLTPEGKVESLPMVLRGYTPNLDRLPHFLLCLGTRVSLGHNPRERELDIIIPGSRCPFGRYSFGEDIMPGGSSLRFGS